MKNLTLFDLLQTASHIGTTWKITPLWAPYDMKKQIWIACEGLTHADAEVCVEFCTWIFDKNKVEFEYLDLYESRHLLFPKNDKVLITLGSPALMEKPVSISGEEDGIYKVLMYANNNSHYAIRYEKSHTEAELVNLKKEQRQRIKNNVGDWDLICEVDMLNGASQKLAHHLSHLQLK